MALEYTLDKEAFVKLPEAIQQEYALTGDAYYLQANGMVPKERLDEFRNNNIKLVKENDEYKTHIDAFGDLTKADIEDLRKKAEAGGGSVDEEQLKALVEEGVLKRVSKMNEEHDAAMTTEKTARESAEGMLSKLIIDNSVQTESVKAGVQETAIEDILLRAQRTFKVEDGRAVPYNENEIVYGKDGKTPQTINEWLADQATSAPHLFKESKGSGAPKGDQQLKGGADQNSNLTGINRMRNAHSG